MTLKVGECLEREEYRKGLDYVESQLRGQPNNWKLLQLGLILRYTREGQKNIVAVYIS